jgi:signal peptidase I
MTVRQWEAEVVRITERYLSWRKRRRIARREKQKKKNPIIDWLDAILSAVVIVLLINQYLLQAYQIPSQSMVPTLLVSDRIFVNKLVYGPEIAPGILKMPGFRVPARGDVIIFENPEYLPNKSSVLGPVLMDVLQRVIYMVTLSLVDIDRDQNGNPKHHFLIKREIGVGGDRLRMREGNVEILTPGETEWKPEPTLKQELGFTYPTVRSFTPDDYPLFKASGIGIALELAGLPMTDQQKSAVSRYFQFSKDPQGKTQIEITAINDGKYFDAWRYRTIAEMDPSNLPAQITWTILQNGWYIDTNSIFPMGDNRDDSHDARYFGEVRLAKVLGKGLFRYWPLGRFGLVR